MIKAAFFDIDGTLYDHGAKCFPASTIASLKAMRKKGIKLFVATGRIPFTLRLVTDVFDFDGFLSLNGQYIAERDGTVIHKMAHVPEVIRKLVPLVREKNIPCLIIEERECFPVERCPTIERHFEHMGFPLMELYDPARLDSHEVLQFLIYLSPEESGFLDELGGVEATSAGGDILDIIPKGGGKEVGIAAAARHYGFEQSEIMAFGDGDNDVRMLSWAGIGVALGNGTKAAKAAANYTTDEVGRDGIKKALLHLGILTEEDFE